VNSTIDRSALGYRSRRTQFRVDHRLAGNVCLYGTSRTFLASDVREDALLDRG